MNERTKLKQEENRILSIDFFRGFTMFMLVTRIATIFNGLVDEGKGGAIIAFLDKQLEQAEDGV